VADRTQIVVTALTTKFTPTSTATLVVGGALAATEGRRIAGRGKAQLEAFRSSVVESVLARHPQTRPMTPSEIGEWFNWLGQGFNAINEPAMDAFVRSAGWTQPQPDPGIRAPGQRATPTVSPALSRVARSGPAARFERSRSVPLGPIVAAGADEPLLLERLRT
jgi:hypothetical protein